MLEGVSLSAFLSLSTASVSGNGGVRCGGGGVKGRGLWSEWGGGGVRGSPDL